MFRHLSRTTTLLAVALIVTVQAVVAPASCCVLKSIVSDADACAGVARAAEAPSCCHRPAATKSVTPAHPARVPLEQSDCPICNSDAKLLLGDRIAAPSPLDGDFLSFGHVADVTLAMLCDAAASPAADFDTGEPFRRTALASCAWLCVWRI